MKIRGRSEPVVVTITWDDLWLAAIYQPSLEIAGSPRKVYRDRGQNNVRGGRATEWVEERKQFYLIKLRITRMILTRQPCRAKPIRLKGNTPDFRLRPLNLS